VFTAHPLKPHVINKEEAMIITEKQRKEFEELARPRRFLNDNCHPHVQVIITPTSAELTEGVYSTGEIMDYVKD
jgi:hypothetical protein